jgi:two-component system sensor histidine kinase/response regulator
MVRPFLIFLIISLFQTVGAENNSYVIDSLENLLKETNSDVRKIDLYLDLKDAVLSNQPEKSYEYALTAEKLSIEIRDSTRLVKSILGECDYYTRIGEYSFALEKAYDALNLSTSSKYLLSLCHNRIATIHSTLKNFDEALHHNKMSLKYDIALNDSTNIVIDIHNIGAAYLDLRHFDSALVYLNKSNQYEISKTGNPDPYSLSNIGYVYTELSKFDSALTYHFRAYQLDSLINRQYEMSIDENFIAMTYYKMNKFEESKKYAYKSMFRSRSLNLYDVTIDNYELLYKIYSEEKNYQRAFTFALLTIETLDTLKEKSNESLTIGLETRYRLKEKESILKTKEAEMNLIEKQNKLFIILIVVSISFLISILVTLFIIYRRQRLNRELMHELKQANNSKERLISIISHDLRSSIGTLRGAAKAISEGMTDIDETRDLLESFYPVADSTYDLLENLLNWAKFSQNKLTPFFDIIDIRDLVRKSVEHTLHLSNSKSIKIINSVQSAYIKADRNMLLSVVRNLLTNAVKFSYPGSEVYIYSKISGDQLTVAVQDLGLGMNVETLQKVFDSPYDFHASGTLGEKGSGLGLSLTKIFIQKNGGRIWAESSEGEGSTFFFNLPIVNQQVT